MDFGLSSVSQRTYRGLAFHKCVESRMYGQTNTVSEVEVKVTV